VLVPLSWLKDFVEIVLPLDELCDRLTKAGLEVAAVQDIGALWDDIYVGEILEVRPHPNAQRLTIADVDYGRGAPLSVITGAPNIPAGTSGQKVALALVGAQLYDGHSAEPRLVTLHPMTLRGVRSEGMICSEKELGLSDEHEGVMILDHEAPRGVPLRDYLGDTVLELDLTPNLGRALSMVGVAREVAALTGAQLHIPEPQMADKGPDIGALVQVEILDPDLCSRYTASLIRGVRVGPSPRWMQQRLLLAGQRPINNIVDITNYVMLEWGQPLHAFDYDKLTHGHIIVRRAQSGERIITLDGMERELDSEMLLITDESGPIAIAGVMGGYESEVTEGTENVLLEGANFNSISIRRTSGALKLPSEASLRFGRGLDPESTVTGIVRASELMRETVGGTIAQGLADCYPVIPQVKQIEIAPAEVKRILGMDVPLERMAEILTSLEFQCQPQGEGLLVTVPSYRLDVSIPADLIEEIARVIGYDQIPSTLMEDALPPQRTNWSLLHEERVRDILVSCGLTEVITYSLTSLEAIARFSPTQERPEEGQYIRLANPLSRERQYLRHSLLPSMVETVESNLRHTRHVAIFEIGRVYLPQEGRELPDEPRRLAIALAGERSQASWLEGDVKEGKEFDFFSLKGIVERLLAELHISGHAHEPTQHPSFHPGKTAGLVVGEGEIGVYGELHPLVYGHYSLPPVEIYLLELDLEALPAHIPAQRYYRPLSPFPPIVQDIAVVINEEVSSEHVRRTIVEVGGELLAQVSLFDRYQGEQIPPGRVSLAYSLTFQAPDRTLTDREVQDVQARILGELERRLGATLREL
jgi:phenylalanyl-tRNA synthetase beta chain